MKQIESLASKLEIRDLNPPSEWYLPFLPFASSVKKRYPEVWRGRGVCSLFNVILFLYLYTLVFEIRNVIRIYVMIFDQFKFERTEYLYLGLNEFIHNEFIPITGNVAWIPSIRKTMINIDYILRCHKRDLDLYWPEIAKHLRDHPLNYQDREIGANPSQLAP